MNWKNHWFFYVLLCRTIQDMGHVAWHQLTSLLTAERVYILLSLFPKMADFLKNSKPWKAYFARVCAVLQGNAKFLGAIPTQMLPRILHLTRWKSSEYQDWKGIKQLTKALPTIYQWLPNWPKELRYLKQEKSAEVWNFRKTRESAKSYVIITNQIPTMRPLDWQSVNYKSNKGLKAFRTYGRLCCVLYCLSQLM